jgi:hypothetical protein
MMFGRSIEEGVASGVERGVTEGLAPLKKYIADLRAENDRFRAALAKIASHDTGMRPDFSVGAMQAKIAKDALS